MGSPEPQQRGPRIGQTGEFGELAGTQVNDFGGGKWRGHRCARRFGLGHRDVGCSTACLLVACLLGACLLLWLRESGRLGRHGRFGARSAGSAKQPEHEEQASQPGSLSVRVALSHESRP